MGFPWPPRIDVIYNFGWNLCLYYNTASGIWVAAVLGSSYELWWKWWLWVKIHTYLIFCISELWYGVVLGQFWCWVSYTPYICYGASWKLHTTSCIYSLYLIFHDCGLQISSDMWFLMLIMVNSFVWFWVKIYVYHIFLASGLWLAMILGEFQWTCFFLYWEGRSAVPPCWTTSFDCWERPPEVEPKCIVKTTINPGPQTQKIVLSVWLIPAVKAFTKYWN